MTNSKTPAASPSTGGGNKNSQTEADVKSSDGQSGQSNKSSHDEKSHKKAGTVKGAGGGKKQERHH